VRGTEKAFFLEKDAKIAVSLGSCRGELPRQLRNSFLFFSLKNEDIAPAFRE
jgi:hypothetical protein